MTVYLVGAGPGDPGLLTVRGAAVLRRADVVVHDRLVDPSLLELAPPRATRIDVGKRPGFPHRQQEINDLLVAHGRTGVTVVRLKGGDPFVFGRGGEEVEALAAAGVPVEVVPGVSSAFAAPAAAGVPVTHRGLSTSVTVVTGHVGDRSAPGGVDWRSLAVAGGTLVVLMGMENRAAIAAALIAGGRPADTPVRVVHWGTTPAQRSTATTLGALADVAMDPPATIVVGAVAGLHLGSVEERPLHGLQVVVTRPRHQAGSLVDALVEAGAAVVALPVVDVLPAADGGAALSAALADVGRYQWLVCTSANAVDRVMESLRDSRALAGVRLAAVGTATAAAFERANLVPDLVADDMSAEGLVAALPPAPSPRPVPSSGGAPSSGGGRPAVLYPRAAAARDVLAGGLRSKGWAVDEVEAYRTGCPDPADLPPRSIEAARQADVVLFASPSAVRHYLSLVTAAGSDMARSSAERTVRSAPPAAAPGSLGPDQSTPAVAPAVPGPDLGMPERDPAPPAAAFGSPGEDRAMPGQHGGLPAAVCIGPVTADAAARAGLLVVAVADDPSPDAMVAAVARWAAGQRRQP